MAAWICTNLFILVAVSMEIIFVVKLMCKIDATLSVCNSRRAVTEGLNGALTNICLTSGGIKAGKNSINAVYKVYED